MILRSSQINQDPSWNLDMGWLYFFWDQSFKCFNGTRIMYRSNIGGKDWIIFVIILNRIFSNRKGKISWRSSKEVFILEALPRCFHFTKKNKKKLGQDLRYLTQPSRKIQRPTCVGLHRDWVDQSQVNTSTRNPDTKEMRGKWGRTSLIACKQQLGREIAQNRKLDRQDATRSPMPSPLHLLQ